MAPRNLKLNLALPVDASKALLIAGVPDDPTDMSKRDIVSTRKYDQAEKRLYEV